MRLVDGDTIYRQDAINLLKKWADGYKYIETETELAIRDFQHLPSARKTGQWNTIQGDIVVCSACGMGAPQTMTGSLINRHLEPNRTRYCPNCGAMMEGKEE